ncbi:DUF4190 domain-containing protein [Agrococcus lahaulensis]|nr:DUF4190 domain-containing protein [Agrococcus lahaulensis]
MSVYHYTMPAEPRPASQARTMSIWGLVLGISGFILPWFVNSIVGIVLSGIGLAKEPRGKSLAVWGLIVSIVSLVMTPLTWIFQMAIFTGFIGALGSS